MTRVFKASLASQGHRVLRAFQEKQDLLDLKDPPQKKAAKGCVGLLAWLVPPGPQDSLDYKVHLAWRDRMGRMENQGHGVTRDHQDLQE